MIKYKSLFNFLGENLHMPNIRSYQIGSQLTEQIYHLEITGKVKQDRTDMAISNHI